MILKNSVLALFVLFFGRCCEGVFLGSNCFLFVVFGSSVVDSGSGVEVGLSNRC